MDEKGVSESGLHLVEAGGDTLYPMYFGIACALFAFKGLSEEGMYDEGWFDMREKMLQGSAHLLGLLLVSKLQRQELNASEKQELLQKLKAAETEIQELKMRRTEDGRANEKVVRIFSAQEQRWFSERRSLRQHIGALINDLRILERRKCDEICELKEKLQETELAVKSKDRAFEEEGKRKKELEQQVEDLREASKKEAQAHASELWKHKSAFIELVSNHRQLEAELGRARRRAETVKQQLEFVFEEKEESVFMLQRLSMELQKVRKDSEQKDNVLSAMLRKSKLDTEEKQMLLKEIELSRVRIKRMDSKSKCERRTLRSMLEKQVGSRLGARGGDFEAVRNNKSDLKDYALDVVDLEAESVVYSTRSDEQGFAERDEEHELSADVKQLDGWVCEQARKYRTSIEQRHQMELEAFSEQIRLKDEKLEAYHWRSLSLEVESKGLNSQVEDLSQSISQLRHNKLKLETLLVERESELKSLKDQISIHLNSLNKQSSKCHSSRPELPSGDDIISSKLKFTKKKPAEKELLMLEAREVEQTEEASKDKELLPSSEEPSSLEGVEIHQKEVSKNECLIKERLLWKMDIHALGVSYKIKRLKQQLVMLERLMGKHGDRDSGESEDQVQMRADGFLVLLSLLNKQVGRYHSLQDKADDLCKRMREKDLNVNQGESNSIRTKEDSKTLEHFLEETFQLQRFIVATGQKLMEIHSNIASGFVSMAEKLDGSTSFDMRRFSDNVQGLFRDVQRGLEVRVARIIGDLEGTLACDGIRSSQH